MYVLPHLVLFKLSLASTESKKRPFLLSYTCLWPTRILLTVSLADSYIASELAASPVPPACRLVSNEFLPHPTHTNLMLAAPASVSLSAGSPPVNWSPSPSPPPPPPPPPTPRRTAAPVASRRLACERCVRRLESSSGVEPRCVFRVGRVKCDYCVQVGHACKKVRTI
jgi:hypothetical protein